MKVAVVASLLAKWDVDINSGHVFSGQFTVAVFSGSGQFSCIILTLVSIIIE